MAEEVKKCAKCGKELCDECTCGCEATVCCACCACDEGCTCGCKDKKDCCSKDKEATEE